MENALNNWTKENTRLTKESCQHLLVKLKRQHLDPIVTQLTGKDGAKVSLAQIDSSYSAIEKGFEVEAKGDEDVCAQFRFEIHHVSITRVSPVSNVLLLRRAKYFL